MHASDIVIAKVETFGPDVIGVQCNFTTERYRALRVLKQLKKLFPDALLIVGGHDASRDPEWFLQTGFDVIVVGVGAGWVGVVADGEVIEIC